VVGWLEGTRSPTTPHHAWVAASADKGRTWSTPVQVDHAPSGTNGVQTFDLAGTGAELIAAYDHRLGNGAGNDLFVRRSADGGQTFSAPFRLNPTPGTPLIVAGADVQVALAGSRGLAAWIDFTSAQGAPLARITQDGGLTWSPPVALSSSGAPAVRIGSSDPFFYSAKDARGGATLGWIQSTTTWEVRAATIHQPDLVVNGTVAPGQSFSFTVRNTDRADAGDVALVVLSATGIGNQTGGIPLFDGKVLDLDFDAVTSLGLTVPLAFLTATIANNQAQTPTLAVPPGIQLPSLWAAAVVLPPPNSPALGSMTDTIVVR
jgi:hypothetical protein